MKRFLILCILLSFGFFNCQTGNNNDREVDYSGRYYVCLGSIERMIMEIARSGTEVTFTTKGPLVMEGTGRIVGRVLTLSANIPGSGEFRMEVVSEDRGETFLGESRIVGSIRMEATIKGQRNPWPTYDLATNPIPIIATANVVDLSKISRVSRFRSGEGHDYSDDFETCRSMKHYFLPKDGVSYGAIELYAPVTGTVIGTLEEYESTMVSKGKQVGIRPDGNPAFWVSVFHVNLASPLKVGDRLEAGRLLGTSAKTSGTATDVAFWVHTPDGDKLLSFFELMDNSVFAIYEARGVANRQAPIISREDRDADPLTCVGEDFLTEGNIPNWIYLSS